MAEQRYFKVVVTGDTKVLTSNSVGQRVALNAHVDEGLQYRLARITFEHNRAIKEEHLRHWFPIQDGEIFAHDKVAEGLETIRKMYGEWGYLNFVSVPETKFNDDNRTVQLNINVDEGKQFHVSDIKVVGMEETERDDFLMRFPFQTGDVFDTRRWDGSLQMIAETAPTCECTKRGTILPDEKAGTVSLTLDFSPCSGGELGKN